MADKNMDRAFEEWAGNKPVEFPDIDKDPTSFWCWKAWQKATEIEREACASMCESQTEGFAATSTWDEAALACARSIRARKVGAGGTAKPVAWIRFCSDGCYEGPIMDEQIEDVRRNSGAWTPLYARHNHQISGA